MRSVAFFIEPAVFRRDPAMFGVWAGWVARIAAINPAIDVTLISGRAVCDTTEPSANLRLAVMDLRPVLAAYDFCLADYSADMTAAPTLPEQPEMTAALRSAAGPSEPSVVISFTENRYLRLAFPRAEVLFTELGSLPQVSVPHTLFLDPVGHLSGVLNTRADRLIALDPPMTVSQADALWDAHVAQRLHAQPQYPAVRDWIGGLGAGPLTLLVLQPADHPNYRPFTVASGPEALVQGVAASCPTGVMVVTFHKDDVFAEPLKASIQHDFPNVVFPPHPLQSGLSELMVGLVDRVVTFSSNAGFTAMLQGTPVTTLGSARYSALADHLRTCERNGAAHRAIRRNLLAFFSNGYLNDL
ncbi:MAG: hypothetical protein H7Z10_11890, partial [Gemmatimonadaceae bacterium]|nr:hypothetical protein [Acetobacteraceae bacterium]